MSKNCTQDVVEQPRVERRAEEGVRVRAARRRGEQVRPPRRRGHVVQGPQVPGQVVVVITATARDGEVDAVELGVVAERAMPGAA